MWRERVHTQSAFGQLMGEKVATTPGRVDQDDIQSPAPSPLSAERQKSLPTLFPQPAHERLPARDAREICPEYHFRYPNALIARITLSSAHSRGPYDCEQAGSLEGRRHQANASMRILPGYGAICGQVNVISASSGAGTCHQARRHSVTPRLQPARAAAVSPRTGGEAVTGARQAKRVRVLAPAGDGPDPVLRGGNRPRVARRRDYAGTARS